MNLCLSNLQFIIDKYDYILKNVNNPDVFKWAIKEKAYYQRLLLKERIKYGYRNTETKNF